MNLDRLVFNPGDLGPTHVVTLELTDGNQYVVETMADLEEATIFWKKRMQEAAETPVEDEDDSRSRYRLFTVKLDVTEYTEDA